MADDFTELAFGDQQPGADPAFDVVAITPAFHVAADGFDNRKRALDDVGAAQRAAQLFGHPELMNGQRLGHAFFEAAGGARVQVH